MSTAQHTPGPWAFSRSTDFGDARFYVSQAEGAPYTPNYSDVATLIAETVSSERARIQEANARLIATAPDYHDAAHWIEVAVANNAAPVNAIAALEEMALNGQHVTLDAGLVLDLLKAHAKAAGSAA